ncbi:carbohydrate kinase [Xanthomonas albilineans]|uniref:Putative fructokinase protein n=1 Tax=Xanthomonas albilineans (strain GPE PC73 / CFBP 7063) TaxID=380358 RepID=D2UFR0_XANAP|nr:carbohydrate kinase [Xanthomonas albilineans]CBA17221.1 putative fructokinase protein [Xanthomonas albilineans GPE PC73]
MFVVCGEALYDIFIDGYAGTSVGMTARQGGSPFNVAIGLARLGSASALFTGLSTDPLGRQLRATLERERVTLDYCVDKREATTLVMVALDAGGVPNYAFYGTGCADRALTSLDLPTLAPAVGGLHFGSYTLVAETTASTFQALAERERAQRLISLDPNVRPTVEPDMAVWRARLTTWIALAHVIKVSQEDIELLYPDQDPFAIARSWLQQGPSLVVMTLGGDGAVAWSGDSEVRVAGRVVQVADTVGAGDSFQAALLHQLPNLAALSALGSTPAALEQLVRFCVAAAAINCTRAGANPPSLDEVRSAL